MIKMKDLVQEIHADLQQILVVWRKIEKVIYEDPKYLKIEILKKIIHPLNLAPNFLDKPERTVIKIFLLNGAVKQHYQST